MAEANGNGNLTYRILTGALSTMLGAIAVIAVGWLKSDLDVIDARQAEIASVVYKMQDGQEDLYRRAGADDVLLTSLQAQINALQIQVSSQQAVINTIPDWVSASRDVNKSLRILRGRK